MFVYKERINVSMGINKFKSMFYDIQSIVIFNNDHLGLK